jgi:rod shape-determining protein MreD
MTLYLAVPLLIAIAILQTTIVPELAVWGVFADLPLLVVVSWSLLRGSREGIVWGFITGLTVDLFSGAPFGAATLPMVLVGLLSGLGQATIFRAHIALPLVVMFLATVFYDLLFLSIVRLSGYPVTWLESLLRLILPSALLNALLVPVVFVIMRWLSTRFGREEMEW